MVGWGGWVVDLAAEIQVGGWVYAVSYVRDTEGQVGGSVSCRVREYSSTLSSVGVGIGCCAA